MAELDASLWAYLAGQVVGRLLAAYLIVWLVCWLLARFDGRAAFRHSRRGAALLAVAVLFLLGLGSLALRIGSV